MDGVGGPRPPLRREGPAAPLPWAVPGYPPGRTPSGLFPSGPPRPVYREPFPVRSGPVILGAAAAALWMMLFGLLASTVRGYAWTSLAAGAAAGGSALLLARFGERGVAVGAAITSGFGVAVAAAVVAARWIAGDWVLW